MAIQTKVASEFDGGNVRWEYDWNDATLKLTAFRCTNTTGSNTRGTLTSQANGQRVSQLVGPIAPAAASPWSQNISAAVANQFNLSVDTRGRLVGIEHNFEWPVTG